MCSSDLCVAREPGGVLCAMRLGIRHTDLPCIKINFHYLTLITRMRQPVIGTGAQTMVDMERMQAVPAHLEKGRRQMQQHGGVQAAAVGERNAITGRKHNARQNRFKRAFEYLVGVANSGLIQRR